MNAKIATDFRYNAASRVLHLAHRTQETGLERNLSARPKEGWVKGGTGLYCLPHKIYEALQYYEIANEIYPSASTLNLKAIMLETLLDFPAALQAYQYLEEWIKTNDEQDISVYIQVARFGQTRCQGKPKGSFPGIPDLTESVVNFSDNIDAEKIEVDEVAIGFVDALIQRDYQLAYSMTTQDFQKHTTLSRLQEQFEWCCPLDYGEFDVPDILSTMDEWPNKRLTDIRWLYITIGGATNEAVTVVVAREGENLKISEVDIGRP